MRKSISGFILGLIGVISGIFIGYIAYVLLTLILAFSKFNFLTYSVYLIWISLGIAFIALFFYFNKARIGGYIMLVAAITYAIPFICALIALFSSNTSIADFIFQFAVGLIPLVLLSISSVIGIASKTQSQITPNI